MKLKILLVILMLLTLSSCAYKEPNATFTVTAVGFSQNVSGNTVIQVQIAKGVEKDGSGPETFEVSGEGGDGNAALYDMKTKLLKEPSFEHCELIVLTGSVSGEQIEEVLLLCEEIGTPLRTRLIYTESISQFLKNSSAQASDIVSLLKQGYKEFGFGGNTALFEIRTALLINDGNFALPRVVFEDENIKLDGLCKYENSIPGEFLNLEQSVAYAKEVVG